MSKHQQNIKRRDTAYKRGNGSPENDVVGSLVNEGKMVANMGSFCLLIRPTAMFVNDKVTMYVLLSLPFWMSSRIQSKPQMVNEKGSAFVTSSMLILAASKRTMPSSTS